MEGWGGGSHHTDGIDAEGVIVPSKRLHHLVVEPLGVYHDTLATHPINTGASPTPPGRRLPTPWGHGSPRECSSCNLQISHHHSAGILHHMLLAEVKLPILLLAGVLVLCAFQWHAVILCPLALIVSQSASQPEIEYGCGLQVGNKLFLNRCHWSSVRFRHVP